jgi:hypothetical protein
VRGLAEASHALQLPEDTVALIRDIGGAGCGSVVVLRSRSLPGRARLMHPASQASAPQAGPTVRFELVREAARGVATALGADPV